jgi:microcystin-dependent protein
MSTPYISEIRIFSFNFAPKGWAMCNGQLLPINQNQALFSLMGTTYGGDGRTNFALPNLQGNMPIHEGTSIAGNQYVLGQAGGEQYVTLSLTQIPQHTHTAYASSTAANSGSPANAFWAGGNQPAYASTAGVTMNPAAVGAVGGSQPHNNLAPFLVLNFCIALVGIFPSRN